MYSWSENDDIIAFYLYLYSTKEINFTYDKISKKLGMSIGSLNMRRKIYKHLDNKLGGLCNAAGQTIIVFERFKGINCRVYKEIVDKLLA
ncbi:hypothetical protein [Clostridium estertheticum]|uniref:Uncharacterized protein n=1 Tax=Clostridium estertheticum subsp. estertheticum TaxID=1552 RepID=A0A1J0GFI1_9CLOT|nr:hypothetical protein [Clostridium estertheticum]APC39646.1 hypothetical protein A7L45_05975 [Clostridium estertheticum subsp. estertheticum]MBZ9614319.1 hypothetical protein [Clostridium estertheticum subsp. laramiense]WAG74256.1 hypothetical protein LL032_02015 [Clostridium estertheticum]